MAHDQHTFWRGALETLKDGLLAGTSTVGNTHLAILDSLPDTGIVGRLQQFITTHVYRLVLGITWSAGSLLEQLAKRLPLPGEDTPLTSAQVLVMSSINGAFGDSLAREGRLWAMRMHLCRHGQTLPLEAEGLRQRLPDARPHLVVFIHGLCLHDRSWDHAHDGFGERWEQSEAVTCVYLRYNTGRPIHENGDRLAEQLERFVRHYPVPLRRITLIGHSMGGLVARSACSYAQDNPHQWLDRLTDVACLGSPHEGAPLERIGHWVTQALGRFHLTDAIARAAQVRSAGIKALRAGSLRHEDWPEDGDEPNAPMRLPVVAGVRYCLIASTWTPAMGDGIGEGLGDGMVPVHSALAEHLGNDAPITRIRLEGVSHLALPRHTDVYGALNLWLFRRHALTAQ